MSLEVKSLAVLVPLCFVGMVYGLTQGEWWTAGVLAVLQVVMVVVYRAEKQRLDEGPGES
jgi:uncharacterized ion transporter superfamily protein YfcC